MLGQRRWVNLDRYLNSKMCSLSHNSFFRQVMNFRHISRWNFDEAKLFLSFPQVWCIMIAISQQNCIIECVRQLRQFAPVSTVSLAVFMARQVSITLFAMSEKPEAIELLSMLCKQWLSCLRCAPTSWNMKYEFSRLSKRIKKLERIQFSYATYFNVLIVNELSLSYSSMKTIWNYLSSVTWHFFYDLLLGADFLLINEKQK